MSQHISELQPYQYLKSFNLTQQRLFNNYSNSSFGSQPKLIPLRKFPLPQFYKSMDNVFQSSSANDKNIHEKKSKQDKLDQQFLQSHRSFMRTVLSGMIKDSQEQIDYFKQKIYSQTIKQKYTPFRDRQKDKNNKIVKQKKQEQIIRRKAKSNIIQNSSFINNKNIVEKKKEKQVGQQSLRQSLDVDGHLIYEPITFVIPRKQNKSQQDPQKSTQRIIVYADDAVSLRQSKSISALSLPKSKSIEKSTFRIREEIRNSVGTEDSGSRKNKKVRKMSKEIENEVKEDDESEAKSIMKIYADKSKANLNAADKYLIEIQSEQKTKMKEYGCAVERNIKQFKEIANMKINAIRNLVKY